MHSCIPIGQKTTSGRPAKNTEKSYLLKSDRSSGALWFLTPYSIKPLSRVLIAFLFVRGYICSLVFEKSVLFVKEFDLKKVQEWVLFWLCARNALALLYYNVRRTCIFCQTVCKFCSLL